MVAKLLPLDQIMDATVKLHAEIRMHVRDLVFAPAPRTALAVALCGMTFEYADSTLILVGSENYTSAMVLVRVQFESLVRAFWVHFAATDAQIARWAPPAPAGLIKEPPLFPMMNEMLAQMHAKAPDQVLQSLNAYKAGAWDAMNSYVHGSLRPIAAFHNGYAPELLSQTIINANCAQMFAAMLLTQMSNTIEAGYGVTELGRNYANVLPPLRN